MSDVNETALPDEQASVADLSPAPVAEDPPVDPPAEVTPLSLYDAAMAPFLAQHSGIGVVSEHQLLAALAAVRNAIAAMVAGPPPNTGGESLDVLGDQRREARAAQVADETPPAAPEEPLPPPADAGAPPPPPEEAFASVTPPPQPEAAELETPPAPTNVFS